MELERNSIMKTLKYLLHATLACTIALGLKYGAIAAYHHLSTAQTTEGVK